MSPAKLSKIASITDGPAMSGREPNIQPFEAYSHESSCLIERRGNTGVISADGQPVGWLRCNPQKAEKEGFRARRRLPIIEF
ncbi:hypothetical protein CBS11350_10102 [Aspergillus niger]|nr:hypothetical protein CBS11350_10102 [Aspergillus niger]